MIIIQRRIFLAHICYDTNVTVNLKDSFEELLWTTCAASYSESPTRMPKTAIL